MDIATLPQLDCLPRDSSVLLVHVDGFLTANLSLEVVREIWLITKQSVVIKIDIPYLALKCWPCLSASSHGNLFSGFWSSYCFSDRFSRPPADRKSLSKWAKMALMACHSSSRTWLIFHYCKSSHFLCVMAMKSWNGELVSWWWSVKEWNKPWSIQYKCKIQCSSKKTCKLVP